MARLARAQADRLRADREVGSEAGDLLGLDPAPEHPLDVAQELRLVDADQRERNPVDPGAPGPADPVDVVPRHHRELVVDDVRERVDVESAGRDIRRDEDVHPAGLEVVEGANALRLAPVAVDRGRGDPVADQLLGEAARAVLRPREDQRLADRAGPDEAAQQLALALAVHRVDDLADQLGRRVASGDLDRGRPIEDAVGQAPDLVGEGGGEEEVLAFRREQGEDLPDVPDEAHVQHPVRLVEDEDLDPREVDGALADVVQEAPRGGDHDLRTGAQGADLRVESDAAVDGGRAEPVASAVCSDALLHLERQLARRDDDEDADRRPPVARRRGGPQPLEDREDERGRLAGPGLGTRKHVAPGEHERDRGRLDGRGLGVALVRDRAEELGRQPELIE